MTQPPGLRERKRQQTRSRIIDAATGLVEKHGFDAVTIEEICAEAEISKRTFFNYMESKDEAVLGRLSVSFDGEQWARLVDTPSDNLVRSALRELADLMTEADGDADPEFRARIRKRRMNITAAEPVLALISLTRYRELDHNMRGAISEHFRAHPGDRRAPGLTADEEASAIVAIVRESLYLSNARSTPDRPSPEDLLESWLDAATELTQLSKGLHW